MKLWMSKKYPGKLEAVDREGRPGEMFQDLKKNAIYFF